MLQLRPTHISVQHLRMNGVPALVLRPETQRSNPPGVLWIHGGGYFLGMKEMVYMGRAMDLVTLFGAVVVSPGYRLAWQKSYPAAAEDCYRVLQYMNDHAETLDFRRDQLMVGGESAGGGLAAALCMMARERGDVKIAFQMPLYPMLSNLDTDSSRDNRGRVWNTQRNHIGWKLYLRQQAGETVSPYASPSHQTDYSGLPLCYTFVGDGEPFYSETLEYVAALKAAGVEAEADVYHTDMHAFDMLNPGSAISRRAVGRFRRHFAYAIEHFYR